MIVCSYFVLKIKLENWFNNSERVFFPLQLPFIHSWLSKCFPWLKDCRQRQKKSALFAYMLYLSCLNHSCVSFLVFFMVQRPPQKYLKGASCRNTVSREQCNEQACFGNHEVLSSVRIILNKLSDSLKPRLFFVDLWVIATVKNMHILNYGYDF